VCTIRDEKLWENAERVGARMVAELRRMQERRRFIGDVRAALDWAFSPGGDVSIGAALTMHIARAGGAIAGKPSRTGRRCIASSGAST